jgi:hypothetical protein
MLVHDQHISAIIEQMVRKKAYGTSQQPLISGGWKMLFWEMLETKEKHINGCTTGLTLHTCLLKMDSKISRFSFNKSSIPKGIIWTGNKGGWLSI